jgi:hypothetical protein
MMFIFWVSLSIVIAVYAYVFWPMLFGKRR